MPRRIPPTVAPCDTVSSDRPDELCARSGSAAGSWGDVSESDALATLCSAYEQGVSFFDTADVYGAGRSEGMVGEAAGLTPKRCNAWRSPL